MTDAASLDPRLYDAGLALLDPASADRVRRFHHRADACREPSRPRVPASLSP